MCVWCVCVLFLHLLEDDLRCLFSPHQVNHGGAHVSRRLLLKSVVTSLSTHAQVEVETLRHKSKGKGDSKRRLLGAENKGETFLSP